MRMPPRTQRRRHARPDEIAEDVPVRAEPAAAALLLAVRRGAGNQAAGRLARRAALDAFVAPRRTELFWNRLP